MTRDVFEEHPLKDRPKFSDDAGDVWPQVSWIVGRFALSRHAERLAGVSGEKGVDCPCNWPGVECCEIAPYWRGCKISCLLGGDDGLSRVFFPLDEASGVKIWLCEHEAHIQATGSGAKTDSVSGR